jgi:hypothetical protein
MASLVQRGRKLPQRQIDLRAAEVEAGFEAAGIA